MTIYNDNNNAVLDFKSESASKGDWETPTAESMSAAIKQPEKVLPNLLHLKIFCYTAECR